MTGAEGMDRRSAKQILIVDDDAGSRDALTNVLQDEGFTVAAVGSGDAALNYLRSSPPPGWGDMTQRQTSASGLRDEKSEEKEFSKSRETTSGREGTCDTGGETPNPAAEHRQERDLAQAVSA